MSSFIVSDRCIDHILSFLESNEAQLLVWEPDAIPPTEKSGKALLRMNERAVNFRYPSKENERRFFRSKEYVWNPLPTSKAQALKSIMCLSYQCTEGNIPESKLFKKLGKLERALAINMASRTDE